MYKLVADLYFRLRSTDQYGLLRHRETHILCQQCQLVVMMMLMTIVWKINKPSCSTENGRYIIFKNNLLLITQYLSYEIKRNEIKRNRWPLTFKNSFSVIFFYRNARIVTFPIRLDMNRKLCHKKSYLILSIIFTLLTHLWLNCTFYRNLDQ